MAAISGREFANKGELSLALKNELVFSFSLDTSQLQPLLDLLLGLSLSSLVSHDCIL